MFTRFTKRILVVGKINFLLVSASKRTMNLKSLKSLRPKNEKLRKFA
jgi:hypothetical protein